MYNGIWVVAWYCIAKQQLFCVRELCFNILEKWARSHKVNGFSLSPESLCFTFSHSFFILPLLLLIFLLSCGNSFASVRMTVFQRNLFDSVQDIPFHLNECSQLDRMKWKYTRHMAPGSICWPSCILWTCSFYYGPNRRCLAALSAICINIHNDNMAHGNGVWMEMESHWTSLCWIGL